MTFFQEMEQYAAATGAPILRAAERDIFLRVLREMKPRRILDIGTAIGYSALFAVTHGAPEATAVTLERDEHMAEMAAHFFARSPYAGRIELLRGDAGTLLPGLSPGFDFVFIDAAKGQYPDYWLKVQPLLGDTAVVVADNVLFRGLVEGDAFVEHRYRTLVYRLREYLALAELDRAFTTEIFDVGDGLAVSWRKRRP